MSLPCDASQRAERRADHATLIASLAPPRPAMSGSEAGPRLVDDAAVAQEDDSVGPRGVRGVVGHEDRRAAAVAVGAEEAHDGLAGHRVERAGRLVGEEDLAAADQRPRDRDALLLAAREVVREAVGQRREAHGVERRLGGGARLAESAGRRAPAGCDTFSRAVRPGEQVEVLEDVADGSSPEDRELASASARRRPGRRR